MVLRLPLLLALAAQPRAQGLELYCQGISVDPLAIEQQLLSEEVGLRVM